MSAYLIVEHIVTDEAKFEEYRVRVGPIFGRRYIFTEKIGLRVGLEKIALSRRCHGSRDLDAESCESCAI